MNATKSSSRIIFITFSPDNGSAEDAVFATLSSRMVESLMQFTSKPVQVEKSVIRLI